MSRIGVLEPGKQPQAGKSDVLSSHYQGQSPLVKCNHCTGCKGCVFSLLDEKADKNNPDQQNPNKDKGKDGNERDQKPGQERATSRYVLIGDYRKKGAEAEQDIDGKKADSKQEDAIARELRLKTARGEGYVAKSAASPTNQTPGMTSSTPMQAAASAQKTAGSDYMSLAMNHANATANAANAAMRRAAEQSISQQRATADASRQTYNPQAAVQSAAQAAQREAYARDFAARAEAARAAMSQASYQNLAHAAQHQSEMDKKNRAQTRGPQNNSAQSTTAQPLGPRTPAPSSTPGTQQLRGPGTPRNHIPQPSQTRNQQPTSTQQSGRQADQRQVDQRQGQQRQNPIQQTSPRPGTSTSQPINNPQPQARPNGPARPAEAARQTPPQPQQRVAQPTPTQQTTPRVERRAVQQSGIPNAEQLAIRQAARKSAPSQGSGDQTLQAQAADRARTERAGADAAAVRRAAEAARLTDKQRTDIKTDGRQAVAQQSSVTPQTARPKSPTQENARDVRNTPTRPPEGPGASSPKPQPERDPKRGPAPDAPSAASPTRGSSRGTDKSTAPAPDTTVRRDSSPKAGPDKGPRQAPGATPEVSAKREFTPKTNTENIPTVQPQGAIERLTARVQERVNRINQSLEQLLNTLLRRDATRSEASPVTAPSKLQELAQEVKSATTSLLRTLKLDKLFSRKEQKAAEPKADRPERQRVPNEKVEQKRETKPLTATAKGPGSQVKEQKKVPVVKNPALTAAVKKAVTNGTLRNGAAMNAAVKNALRTGARPNNALKAASNTLIKGAERKLIKKIEIRIKLLSKKMRSPAVRKKQEKLKALAERQKKLFRHLQALHQRNLEKELRKELKKRREKEILENRRAVDLVLGNGHHPEKAQLTYDEVAELDPLEVEIDLS